MIVIEENDNLIEKEVNRQSRSRPGNGHHNCRILPLRRTNSGSLTTRSMRWESYPKGVPPEDDTLGRRR